MAQFEGANRSHNYQRPRIWAYKTHNLTHSVVGRMRWRWTTLCQLRGPRGRKGRGVVEGESSSLSYLQARQPHSERGVHCFVTIASHQSALLVSCIPRISARRGNKLSLSLWGSILQTLEHCENVYKRPKAQQRNRRLFLEMQYILSYREHKSFRKRNGIVVMTHFAVASSTRKKWKILKCICLKNLTKFEKKGGDEHCSFQNTGTGKKKCLLPTRKGLLSPWLKGNFNATLFFSPEVCPKTFSLADDSSFTSTWRWELSNWPAPLHPIGRGSFTSRIL